MPTTWSRVVERGEGMGAESGAGGGGRLVPLSKWSLYDRCGSSVPHCQRGHLQAWRGKARKKPEVLHWTRRHCYELVVLNISREILEWSPCVLLCLFVSSHTHMHFRALCIEGT